MNRLLKQLTLLALLIYVQTSLASTQPLRDCSQLATPKTALLVHATWCPACRYLSPIYEEASNQETLAGYTLYVREINKFGPVCGINVSKIPVVYKNNMQDTLIGRQSLEQLIAFIKDSV